MKRSLLSLSSITLALLLTACATTEQPASKPAPAAKPAAAAAAPAAPAAVSASDAALAQKFMGTWNGEWEMPGFGAGKFILIITGVEGTNLKGEAHWFGTAAGDLKWPLRTAVVKDGELKATQDGDTTFKLKMKTDTTLAGSWLIKGYEGTLKLKR